MKKEEQKLNSTENPKLGISDVMYRLFWYSIFLVVPYLFISFFMWDIQWITSSEIVNIGIRICYGMYGIICFVPVIIIGVWTPKGMSDIGDTI